MSELTKNNSIILNYIKEQNIDLSIQNIGTLVDSLRTIIYEKTAIKDEIKEIKQFETLDGKKFNDLLEAKNHQQLKFFQDEIMFLLGGSNKDIDPESNGFSNGEGYYVLDKEKLKLAGQLTISFQEELGLGEYPLNSRTCYENEYLNKISHTINCITSLEDGTKIRVGQPFYTANMNELGDKIYGQENIEKETFEISTSIILSDLKSTLNSLRETEDDNEIEALEDTLVNICETILDGFDNGEVISQEEFNTIYKEFVKNDDFLEDEHVDLLKNIKKSFDVKTLENEFNLDENKETKSLKDEKVKNLISILSSEVEVGAADVYINEILDVLKSKFDEGKGIKEENLDSIKSIYKDFIKGNDYYKGSELKEGFKEIKSFLEKELETKENDNNLER